MSLHQRRVGALQRDATHIGRANQGLQVLHQCLLPYPLLQLGADRRSHRLVWQRLAFDALIDADDMPAIGRWSRTGEGKSYRDTAL